MSEAGSKTSQSLPFKIRRRSRNDPVTSQRGMDPLPDGLIAARDNLDEEIDAAVREDRKIDYAKAFPPCPAPRQARTSNATSEPWAGRSNHAPHAQPDDAQSRAGAVPDESAIMGKKELQQRVAHRLLQRQFPKATIATVLGMSCRQAYRVVDKLQERYRQAADELDVKEYVGRARSDYAEWRADALRLWDDTNLPLGDRLRALKLALDLRTAEHRFLFATGFFKGRTLAEGAGNAACWDQEADQEPRDDMLTPLDEDGIEAPLPRRDDTNGAEDCTDPVGADGPEAALKPATGNRIDAPQPAPNSSETDLIRRMIRHDHANPLLTATQNACFDQDAEQPSKSSMGAKPRGAGRRR
jgi:hypothetical protein